MSSWHFGSLSSCDSVMTKTTHQSNSDSMNGSKEDLGEADGPLASMRHYLCEFDPDSGPVGGGAASQLHTAWMTYVQAFEDLCQVQNVSEANRQPLFLLLGGMKLKVEFHCVF